MAKIGAAFFVLFLAHIAIALPTSQHDIPKSATVSGVREPMSVRQFGVGILRPGQAEGVVAGKFKYFRGG